MNIKILKKIISDLSDPEIVNTSKINIDIAIDLMGF